MKFGGVWGIVANIVVVVLGFRRRNGVLEELAWIAVERGDLMVELVML